MGDRHEKIKFLFTEAYRKSPQERIAYLAKSCGEDADLRAEVEALLEAFDGSGDFLEVPPVASAAGGTLDESPVKESPGTVIGRYKLLEKIGEGGMAVVYLAQQEQPLRRQVALKIIKLGMDTKQVIARFEAERQALAIMDHPNIAKVFDAGTTETGRPYFVMELVKGASITEYCDQCNLSTEERLHLFILVCNAVQHAHQKGIIHRDIKPGNVMVTLHDGKPVPKVIDFGIAKATGQRLTEKTLFTRYAQMIGTPEYMSPEQAEMSGLDIDTRTDIYSLGVLLYELLTGVTPFDAEKLRQAGYSEIQRVIREEDPPKPSTRLSTMGEKLTGIAKHRQSNPDSLTRLIRGDLDWMIMKSLEKDRTRRYETVNALSQDIQRYFRHEPIEARPPSVTYKLSKFLRKHRSVVIAASTVTILLIFSLVILFKWNSERQQLLQAESFAHRGILLEARDAFARRDFQSALKQIMPIIGSRHVGPAAKLLYASILSEDRHPEQAMAELENLLEEDPEIAGAAHSMLVRLYWDSQLAQSEKLKKIELHSQKAQELLPKTAEAYFLRALIEMSVPNKIFLLDKALSLDPGHYESLKLRANIYYASKKYPEMENDARVIVALRKEDKTGYLLLGIAQREQKKYQEALENFNCAEAFTPKEKSQLIEVYEYRCQTLMRMGKYEIALNEAMQCMSFEEKRIIHHIDVMCILMALERYDEVKVQYEEIVNRFHLAQNPYLKRYFWVEIANYVFETLQNNQALNLPTNAAHEAAFLPFLEAKEIYDQLAAKASCLITDGFNASWSPEGTTLLYSMGVKGSSAVATYDISSQKTQLLAIPGKDPIYSPDGKYIVYIRDYPILSLPMLSSARLEQVAHRLASEEIWIMKANGTDCRRLAAGSRPAWSHDSKSVLFVDHKDRKLYSIPILDSHPIPSCIISGSRYDTSLLPNQEWGVFSAHRNVIVFDIPSEKIISQWLAPPERGDVMCSWSPEGKAILMWDSFWLDFGCWLYQIETQKCMKLFDGPFSRANVSRKGSLVLSSRLNSSIWVANMAALLPGRTEEHHYHEAIRKYDRKLETDSGDLESYYLRAQCHKSLMNQRNAIEDFIAYEKILESRVQEPEEEYMSYSTIPVILTALHTNDQQYYRETFDSLGPDDKALPPGWRSGPYKMPQITRGAPWGPLKNMSLIVDDGSSDQTGVTCNYGTQGEPDRAVGQIPNSKTGDRGLQLALTNKTGRPITSFVLGYTGEQWRDFGGQGWFVEKIRLYYSTRAGSDFEYMGHDFDFIAPQDQGQGIALDGNNSSNRAIIRNTYTPRFPIAEGETFYLTWHHKNDNGTKNHALAVDDVWLRVSTK